MTTDGELLKDLKETMNKRFEAMDDMREMMKTFMIKFGMVEQRVDASEIKATELEHSVQENSHALVKNEEAMHEVQSMVSKLGDDVQKNSQRLKTSEEKIESTQSVVANLVHDVKENSQHINATNNAVEESQTNIVNLTMTVNKLTTKQVENREEMRKLERVHNETLERIERRHVENTKHKEDQTLDAICGFNGENKGFCPTKPKEDAGKFKHGGGIQQDDNFYERWIPTKEEEEWYDDIDDDPPLKSHKIFTTPHERLQAQINERQLPPKRHQPLRYANHSPNPLFDNNELSDDEGFYVEHRREGSGGRRGGRGGRGRGGHSIGMDHYKGRGYGGEYFGD